MADRIMVIAELGTLATAAAQRGDDRAADVLRDAIRLLVEDSGTVAQQERRRERDRERKKRSTESKDSTESAESAESPNGFPGPLPLPPATTTTTRARGDSDGMVEMLCEQLATQCGDDWPDVDAFVKRRPFATWRGWLRAMLADIGPLSQFAAADLVAVCRDDLALERPIATPSGLRGFLSRARVERTAPKSDNGTYAPPRVRSMSEAQKAVTAIQGLITTTQQPGQAANRFIPKAKIEAMGERVMRAYNQVGGPTRFLSTTGENVSFLVRDFHAALDG